MTTADDLSKYLRKRLKGKKLIVALWREPYTHIKTPNGIKLEHVAGGGAHELLDGVLKITGGTMVAVGSGNADHLTVDEQGKIMVPPGEDKYTLRRIFLKKKELDEFYYGFANQTLWPLVHAVFVKPIFNKAWWDGYVKVNEKFAEAIVNEAGDNEAVVWINDYHFCLVPAMIKKINPKLQVGMFWHIPWPTHEIFRICPWKKEILRGMLQSDFIGFHRGYHIENFLNCAKRELEVIVGYEPRSITHQEHVTRVGNIPAGIDYQEIRTKMDYIKEDSVSIFKKDFGFDAKYVAIGVDRVDYTKGLVERMMIIERFLDQNPEYVGKFSYLSIGAPSRIHIPAYKNLNRQLTDIVDHINWKFSTTDWQPIYFINQAIARDKIFQYYRGADVGLITPLDDGLNLVAKEYVICAKPEKGMLVLSKFAGAANDLKQAILINPYDIEESALKLKEALEMPKEERIKRNNEMKQTLKEYNIYRWAERFIERTMGPY